MKYLIIFILLSTLAVNVVLRIRLMKLTKSMKQYGLDFGNLKNLLSAQFADTLKQKHPHYADDINTYHNTARNLLIWNAIVLIALALLYFNLRFSL